MSSQGAQADLSDEFHELSLQFRDGSHEAFHQLMNHLSPALTAYLRSNAQARIDYEALHQDVWVAVWKNRATFEAKNFRAWLFAIAKNRLRDAAKKKYTTALPEEYDPAAPVEDPKPDLDDELIAMKECLKSIDPVYAEVTQKSLLGIPASRIAEQFDIAVGTVYSRTSRGRELLRLCINGKLSMERG